MNWQRVTHSKTRHECDAVGVFAIDAPQLNAVVGL